LVENCHATLPLVIYLCSASMKKFAIILLIAVYTVSGVGISVNRFYCCGKLESTSVSTLAFRKDNAKDDGCCQHKQTVFTVKDSHEITGIAHVANVCLAFIHTSFTSDPNTVAYKLACLNRSNSINAPPLLLHSPIYIRLCNYRI